MNTSGWVTNDDNVRYNFVVLTYLLIEGDLSLKVQLQLKITKRGQYLASESFGKDKNVSKRCSNQRMKKEKKLLRCVNKFKAGTLCEDQNLTCM